MNNLLEIKDFLRIGSEIKLENFKRINYLVGPNSSGKSSVLSALSFLHDGGNSIYFFNKNSKVEFTLGQKTQKILWSDTDPNHVSHSGDLKIEKILSKKDFPDEKGSNGTFDSHFDYQSVGKDELSFLNDTLELLGQPKIIAKRYCNVEDPYDSNIGELEFYQDAKKVNPRHLANGLRSFNEIRFEISFMVERLKQNVADALFLIIEEPENNLHPGLQKKIPNFIENIVKSLDLSIKEKAFIFIATHSPFIIGESSKFSDQKTYIMSDGGLCDLNLTKISHSEGFSGSDCIQIVSSMLGANIQDLGYPDNYAILEEKSILALLNKTKNLIKNICFVPAGGVPRAADFAETLEQISILDTLINSNIYYSDKYLVIVDNFQSQNVDAKERMNKIKLRLSNGNRFCELSKSNLEDYYEDFNKDIYNRFKAEVSKLKYPESGIVKQKYAEEVGDLIRTKEDFQRLFKKELDFLLK